MKGLEHIVDLCLTRRVSEETMTRARRPLFAMLRSDQQWHRKFSKSRVVFLAFVVFLAETVTAQTVVQRLRVGNSTEGITVALGNSGMVVTVDGWDVIAIPPGLRQPTKLFDLRGRGLILRILAADNSCSLPTKRAMPFRCCNSSLLPAHPRTSFTARVSPTTQAQTTWYR